jgi:hypothetical protein
MENYCLKKIKGSFMAVIGYDRTVGYIHVFLNQATPSNDRRTFFLGGGDSDNGKTVLNEKKLGSACDLFTVHVGVLHTILKAIMPSLPRQ